MAAVSFSAHAAQTLAGRAPLKNPIVLVHGATLKGSRLQIGPFDLGDYFYGISKLLGDSGTPVYVVNLSTDGSIGERAAVLKNFLESDLRGQSVNVIAHSLGGLDARYAISVLKTMQINSLTTIGTPHLGTPLADWAVDQIEWNTPWYWFFRLIGYDMATRRFLPEITTKGMKVFNEKVPNSFDVKYFSVPTRASYARSTMTILLWFPAHWMHGENHYLNANGDDGMVPYDSQKWGKEIASLELDHLGQMNHHEMRLQDMRVEAKQLYMSIYDQLASEGL